MVRKIFTIGLLFVLSGNLFVYAQPNSSKRAGENKRRIVELGINKNVKLKLNSGESLAGQVTEIKPESFVLQLVDKNGQTLSREVMYTDVNKISQTGNQSASGTFKRGVIKGAGIYVGLLVASGVALLIAAAVIH